MALTQVVSARRLAVLWAAAALLCGLVVAAPAASDDDYTDENRPYEFGFVIEGQQHRHEKKDERGIIMGEFGFITADGVYHVTVYATDENGDFKIISMKNIRLGPPLDQMRTAPRSSTTTRPVAQPRGPPAAAVAAPIASPRAPPLPAVTSSTTSRAAVRLNGVNGCSGCLIPTTTAAPPPAIGAELQPPFVGGPASVGAPGQPGGVGGGITSGVGTADGFGGDLGGGPRGGNQDRIAVGVSDRIGGGFGSGRPSGVGGGITGVPGGDGGGVGGITGTPVRGGSAGAFGSGDGGSGRGVNRGGSGNSIGSQGAGLPGQPPGGAAAQPGRPYQPEGQRPRFGATPTATPAGAPSRGGSIPGQPGSAPPSAQPGLQSSPVPFSGTPVRGGSAGAFGGGDGGTGRGVNRLGGNSIGRQGAGQPGQQPSGAAAQPGRPYQPEGQRPRFGATPPGTPAGAPSRGGSIPDQLGSAPPSTQPGLQSSPVPFSGQTTPPGTRQQGVDKPAPFGQRPSSGAGATGGGVQAPIGGGRAPPGEPTRDGLPPGVSMQDVMDALLYRFNYTLPYHGHNEEGYRSGNKLGGYFADGRDGVGRSVKYLANEFGYQPNITLVDLRPDQAHTEEDERNAPLLGYKFEWLY